MTALDRRTTSRRRAYVSNPSGDPVPSTVGVPCSVTTPERSTLVRRPRVSCERHAELGFVAAVWSATRGRCA